MNEAKRKRKARQKTISPYAIYRVYLDPVEAKKLAFQKARDEVAYIVKQAGGKVFFSGSKIAIVSVDSKASHEYKRKIGNHDISYYCEYVEDALAVYNQESMVKRDGHLAIMSMHPHNPVGLVTFKVMRENIVSLAREFITTKTTLFFNKCKSAKFISDFSIDNNGEEEFRGMPYSVGMFIKARRCSLSLLKKCGTVVEVKDFIPNYETYYYPDGSVVRVPLDNTNQCIAG